MTVLDIGCGTGAITSDMVNIVGSTGKVIVLDYNHEKITWEPEIPESMAIFYKAFLNWRAESGMNNTIADDLEGMFHESGLKNISISNQSENTHHSDLDFATHIYIWSGVVSF